MDMHPVPSPCRVRKVGALAPQHWLVRKKSYVNKVPALNHEVLDEPVGVDALEASRDPAALELASAELSEVLSRLGHHVGIQFHDDPANLLIIHLTPLELFEYWSSGRFKKQCHGIGYWGNFKDIFGRIIINNSKHSLVINHVTRVTSKL